MGNRAKATAFILNFIGKIDPSDTQNVELMRTQLESMSDEQFEQYMTLLRKPKDGNVVQGRQTLTYYAPNLSKTKIKLNRNLEIAEELGHSFFERLWITDPQTGETYLTPNQHLVMDLPVRRQAQIHEKKASIPLHANSVDELSGQVTGDSKGSKISFPELQAQVSQQLDNTIIEEIKIRGGDQKAYQEFEKRMIETGSCSQNDLLDMGTRAKSTDTASTLLKGMHLGNNL